MIVLKHWRLRESSSDCTLQVLKDLLSHAMHDRFLFILIPINLSINSNNKFYAIFALFFKAKVKENDQYTNFLFQDM
jgi:hypothetical protein